MNYISLHTGGSVNFLLIIWQTLDGSHKCDNNKITHCFVCDWKMCKYDKYKRNKRSKEKRKKKDLFK